MVNALRRSFLETLGNLSSILVGAEDKGSWIHGHALESQDEPSKSRFHKCFVVVKQKLGYVH
jgi:hypothetical protein